MGSSVSERTTSSMSFSSVSMVGASKSCGSGVPQCPGSLMAMQVCWADSCSIIFFQVDVVA